MNEFVVKLIEEISQYYLRLVSDWKKESKGCRPYNLNKYQIRDVIYDPAFLAYLDDFHNYLTTRLQLTIPIMELAQIASCKVEVRVKLKASIEDKIDRYNRGTLQGKMKVNKCLNDLAGFRIILNPQITRTQAATDFNAACSIKYGSNLKVTDASKNGYVATHIYLKADNLSFPCEVQLWDENDEDENIRMHSLYKEGYNNDVKKGSE